MHATTIPNSRAASASSSACARTLGCHLGATWVPLGCHLDATWMRPNHLWTGKENLSWKCPSCRDDGKGTIEHYILFCPAYHAERQVMLTTIAAAEGIKEKLLQQAQAL